MEKVKNSDKKNDEMITPKAHAHLETMTETPAKLQMFGIKL